MKAINRIKEHKAGARQEVQKWRQHREMNPDQDVCLAVSAHTTFGTENENEKDFFLNKQEKTVCSLVTAAWE
jgi:hypothetical protein